VEIALIEDAKAAGTGMGLDRSSVIVNFAGDQSGGQGGGNRVNVTMRFKSIPLPEGAARMLDTLNMTIGKQEGTK
jgi:hypothetical protein